MNGLDGVDRLDGRETDKFCCMSLFGVMGLCACLWNGGLWFVVCDMVDLGAETGRLIGS